MSIPALARRLLPALLAGFAAALAGCAPPPPPPERPTLVWPPPPDEPRFYFEGIIRSSADVQEITAADRLRFFATGESLTGRPMAKPFDVEAYRGRVFVSDTVDRVVHVFDFARKRYYRIGEKGIGTLAKPLGIELDPARGLLYVCDGTAKRVVVFDFDGRYVTSFAQDVELNRPSGLAVSRDGERIYVVDTGGVDTTDHRVLVFDRSGRHLFDFGTRGSEPGQFNFPISAAVAPDGEVYVVDGGNFRVQVFGPDGEFRRSFGKVGRVLGTFSRPKDVAIDAEERVYVTDAAFGNFQIFTENGELLLFIGERSPEGGPGQYMLTSGIGIDEVGRVYVVDQFFRKVDVFRPAGVPEGTLGRDVAANNEAS